MHTHYLDRHSADELKAAIRAANPLPNILRADGCILKRAGSALVCLCPFHEEKSPSFNVRPIRERFKCFGCGVGGDVITYVMRRDGVGFMEACRRLAARAGLAGFDAARLRPSLLPTRPVAAPQAPDRVVALPTFRTSREGESERVASLRGLGVEGVWLAERRGLLRFGQVCGSRCWILTDAAGVNAQARRMDGERFPSAEGGEGRKAHTLRGSRAAWPIGAREAGAFGSVALVEGGPDLLAACHFIAVEGRERDIAPVAMLGASQAIPEDALLLLTDKRVRLYPHLDLAGFAAAVRWTGQLERVGCTVDAFRFDGLRRADGGAVADLNDLAHLGADCYHAEAAELAEVLPR